MKKIIILTFVSCMLFIACNKDKFKTQPQITIDSYNTKVVASGQSLIMQLKFTDKEGDIGGGQLVYFPVRTNRRPLPPDQSYLDSVSNTVPMFPNNTTGYYQLNLPWNLIHKGSIENDTIFFRFVAVDRAGNRSDTVNSDKIVVLYQ